MTTTREMTHQKNPAQEQGQKEMAAAAATPITSNDRISRGERIFKWMTYGGIGAVATFFATLKLGYWQKYAPGPKFYHSGIEWLKGKGINEKIAKDTMETTNLMHGGNAMTLLVIAAEYFHKPIVGFINRIVGDHAKPADEEIPKQTAGSLIKGRILAWGVVLGGLWSATSVFPKPFLAFENKAGELLCKILGKSTQLHGVESKTFRYGKLAALDVFATITSATLLFVGSQFFAKKAAEKKIARASTSGAPHASATRDGDADEVPDNAPIADLETARNVQNAAPHTVPAATISRAQHDAIMQPAAAAALAQGAH